MRCHSCLFATPSCGILPRLALQVSQAPRGRRGRGRERRRRPTGRGRRRVLARRQRRAARGGRRDRVYRCCRRDCRRQGCGGRAEGTAGGKGSSSEVSVRRSSSFSATRFCRGRYLDRYCLSWLASVCFPVPRGFAKPLAVATNFFVPPVSRSFFMHA